MKKLLIPAAVLLLAACHPKTAPKTSTPATDPVAEVKSKYDATQIDAGKAIFEANCGKCHKLKQPSEMSIVRWEKILPPMSAKAKLSAEDAGKVRAWVLVNAKG